jgi:hypothetical protein
MSHSLHSMLAVRCTKFSISDFYLQISVLLENALTQPKYIFLPIVTAPLAASAAVPSNAPATTPAAPAAATKQQPIITPPAQSAPSGE